MDQLSVVVADDDQEFCRALSDHLSLHPLIDVAGVAHEGLYALKLASETDADILLLDMIMPGMDGVGVLDRLRQLDREFRPGVIAFGVAGRDDIARKAKEYGVEYYVRKPFDPDVLIPLILEGKRPGKELPLVPLNKEAAREVTMFINRLRIPKSFKGYTYLCEAVMMTIADPTVINEVTKGLYARIAEKNGTTGERVERAMRFAIETAWDRGELDSLQSIFGYTIDERKGKPTNVSFIAKVADEIRLNLLARRSYPRHEHE